MLHDCHLPYQLASLASVTMRSEDAHINECNLGAGGLLHLGGPNVGLPTLVVTQLSGVVAVNKPSEM